MVPTVDCTEENQDKTMNINMKGIWLCSDGTSFVTGQA
jgi:hypothetical protein